MSQRKCWKCKKIHLIKCIMRLLPRNMILRGKYIPKLAPEKGHLALGWNLGSNNLCTFPDYWRKRGLLRKWGHDPILFWKVTHQRSHLSSIRYWIMFGLFGASQWFKKLYFTYLFELFIAWASSKTIHCHLTCLRYFSSFTRTW